MVVLTNPRRARVSVRVCPFGCGQPFRASRSTRSHAWNPNRELLAVGSWDGGPVIWNLSKFKDQLDEIGLGGELESHSQQKLSGSEQLCVVPIEKAAGETMPPSTFLTGPAPPERLVCAPGPMASSWYCRPIAVGLRLVPETPCGATAGRLSTHDLLTGGDSHG
jgi:hypothetical protein